MQLQVISKSHFGTGNRNFSSRKHHNRSAVAFPKLSFLDSACCLLQSPLQCHQEDVPWMEVARGCAVGHRYTSGGPGARSSRLTAKPARHLYHTRALHKNVFLQLGISFISQGSFRSEVQGEIHFLFYISTIIFSPPCRGAMSTACCRQEPSHCFHRNIQGCPNKNSHDLGGCLGGWRDSGAVPWYMGCQQLGAVPSSQLICPSRFLPLSSPDLQVAWLSNQIHFLGGGLLLYLT